MLFGAEPIEFVLFLKQVGFALAGASALWGFVFLVVRERINHEKRCVVLEWIAGRLLIPLFGGFVLAMLSWLMLSFMIPAHAHEGVTVAPALDAVYRALDLFLPLALIWSLVTIAGFVMLKRKQDFFYRNLKVFYIVEFIFIAILISFPSWVGSFGTLQWFFIMHSVHSILTVGTVLILDFLFLISKSSAVLKQHIYPLFPMISKVIWVGLGIDFVSVFLIYQDALVRTPKFFFMQTLIGIVIINGVLLSGVITRKLIRTVAEDGRQMERRWMLVADFAGAVSITTWLTITFLDSFHNLTLGYGTLMTSYLLLVMFLFVGHTLWKYLHRGHIPLELKT